MKRIYFYTKYLYVAITQLVFKEMYDWFMNKLECINMPEYCRIIIASILTALVLIQNAIALILLGCIAFFITLSMSSSGMQMLIDYLHIIK